MPIVLQNLEFDKAFVLNFLPGQAGNEAAPYF